MTLPKFGVPLHAAFATGDLASIAAKAGGVPPPDPFDLIEPFVRAMPADLIALG